MIKFIAGIICIAVLIIAFFKIKQDLSWVIENCLLRFIYSAYKKDTLKNKYVESSLDEIYEFIDGKYFYVYNEELCNDINMSILSSARLIINSKYLLISFKEWKELFEHIHKLISISPNLDRVDPKYQNLSYRTISTLCEKLNMNISIGSEFSISKKDDMLYLVLDDELFSILITSPTLLIYVKYITDNNIKYLLKSEKNDMLEYALNNLKKLDESNDIPVPMLATVSGSVEKILLKIMDNMQGEF